MMCNSYIISRKIIYLFLGILCGIIFSFGIVHASNLISAKDVLFVDNTGYITSSNVQTAIDEIYNHANNNCPEGKICYKLCRVTVGTGLVVGNEVKCGTESFYIYDAEGDNVKLLSKYNLKVGGVYYTSYTPYTESEMTYLQDSSMKGWTSGRPYYGTTVYSSSSQKGENYSDYSGSMVEIYVNKYAQNLREMGLNVSEARLVTMDELTSSVMGCSTSSRKCSGPAWVYDTSYWTEFANGTESVWAVYSDGTFYSDDFDYNGAFGVRPVIVIPKSEF